MHEVVGGVVRDCDLVAKLTIVNFFPGVFYMYIGDSQKFMPRKICCYTVSFPPHSLSHPVSFLSPSSPFLPLFLILLSLRYIDVTPHTPTKECEASLSLWRWWKGAPVEMTNWGVGTSHHTSTYHSVVPSYPPFFQLLFPHQSTISPPIAISPSFLLAILLRSILLSFSLATLLCCISLSFSSATLLHCIHILCSLFEVSIFCTGREESLSSLSSLPVDRKRRKE